MKLPFSIPTPNGSERARQSKAMRDLATEVSRNRPHAITLSNGEEADFAKANFPSNFTKGLKHNKYGLLETAAHYYRFVEAINSDDPGLFDTEVIGAIDATPSGLFKCKIEAEHPLAWRGWESPRAGHVFELQGPDADSVGMAPPPRIGSSELAAEMAELYAMALLRDVPFTSIVAGDETEKLCADGSKAALSATEIAKLLNGMPYFDPKKTATSSTGQKSDATSGLNGFETARREARTFINKRPARAPLTAQTLFRGSTAGAQIGPYISQFLLIGSNSRGMPNMLRAPSHPAENANFSIRDGLINYGTLNIDQRTSTHKACLDYMTDWQSWLDVQNGANFKGLDVWEEKRRFITTPRDLATYVHFDALYEAYLNAVFLLDSMKVPVSKGFPEPSISGRRDNFATFGGPHILSLSTEIATRCLKAARRQKFNLHRRARPEAIAGRLTLEKCKSGKQLGCAQPFFASLCKDLPGDLVKAITLHNEAQNTAAMAKMRRVNCPTPGKDDFNPAAECNLLLPMAFPEGSPMHPAYAAGHATVAGGCVTVIKAYFEMFEDCDARNERRLEDFTKIPAQVPTADGMALTDAPAGTPDLSIQGELDKLAANIAIGRNMAGVHFYSDYYDSLRLGERVAVGLLMEQCPTYGDPMEMTFTSFDGDCITISGQANSAPVLTVLDRAGKAVSPRDWWLRHVSGEQILLPSVLV